jgi:ABC-type lipoprotein release transport system permease subunit
MGRAILAISGSAIALLPRPFAVIGSLFSGFWREMTRDIVRPYRPELHYMRGPGPAWRAKHGLPSA